PYCYVCGQQNERGLKVSFSPHPSGGSRAEYVSREEHVGWPEVIHGGVLFTLLDEAVAWAVIYAGLHGVTAKAEVKFRAPVRVGTPLAVRVWLTEPAKRLVRARAEIREGSDVGPVVVELEAVMALSPPG
ncbi:MAG: PaaI family thioesterase, partial [Acidobacteria bacterium]